MTHIQPAWKPEVGRLYRNTKSLAIKELKAWVSGEPHFEGYRYDFIDGTCAYEFFSDFIPIAELEGLKSGDTIWCIAGSGVTEYYTIESVFSNNLTAYCGKGYVSVYFDGSACMFGNGKQLFWRTEDRAERFGRGE